MQYIFTYWREILAGLAVIIALYSYVEYIRSTLTGKTEPHFFSWGIWTLTTGIAFFAQVSGGGGAGTVPNGVTFIVCLFVLSLAIKYGKIGKLDLGDYLALFFSMVAIVLWLITDNPFYGSMFATLADMIGYVPTFRKVWKKPQSEPTGYYIIMNIKHIFSLLALSVYSWTTMIFSGSIIIMNLILIGIQIFRQKK